MKLTTFFLLAFLGSFIGCECASIDSCGRQCYSFSGGRMAKYSAQEGCICENADGGAR